MENYPPVILKASKDGPEEYDPRFFVCPVCGEWTREDGVDGFDEFPREYKDSGECENCHRCTECGEMTDTPESSNNADDGPLCLDCYIDLNMAGLRFLYRRAT